ncbi:hypothetical protein D3C75_1282090 [compost metagenome]
MSAVGFDYHRATCSEGRGGVTTSCGEGQGKVAGAEDSNRAYANAHLADVHPRKWLTIRQCQVDSCAEEVAPT